MGMPMAAAMTWLAAGKEHLVVWAWARISA